MIQVAELANLILNSIFIIYLFYLVRTQSRALRSYWFAGILLIFISQIFTIAEGYYYPVIFNIIEHLSTAAGSILFLLSFIKKELFGPQ